MCLQVDLIKNHRQIYFLHFVFYFLFNNINHYSIKTRDNIANIQMKKCKLEIKPENI